MDDQRGELSRKVEGAAVVGAVGGEHRQAVGVVVGARQVAAGRPVGFVAVGLGDGGLTRFQRAIDFVVGDVEEAEVVLRLAIEAVPVGAHRFGQAESANDARLDEIFRAMDAAFDARFGGKTDRGTELVLGKPHGDEVHVADVSLDDAVGRTALEAGDLIEVAGAGGQRVEVDDRLIRFDRPIEDEIAADQAGAACDDDGHGYRLR